jgi:hypothetical protein
MQGAKKMPQERRGEFIHGTDLTKLLLPLFSTGFHPDGNSPGKYHGK